MKTVEYDGKTFYEIPKGKGKYFICKETTEILSLMRPQFPKILKQVINKNGYYMVGFFTRPDRINMCIHRAMMETFVKNPNNYRDINHIDGNKLNNQLNNLEYCTSKENIQHSFKTGLHKKFTNKHIYQFTLNGEFLNEYKSLREAAKAVNCDPANICVCLKNKTKHAMGYLWSYENKITLPDVPIKVLSCYRVIENNKEDKIFTNEKDILEYLKISRTCLYDHCRTGKPLHKTVRIIREYK